MAVHNPNWPLVYDQLAVNVGANDTADPAWLDLTDRVVSRSLAAGRSSEMDHTEAADNTYQIRDRDEVFNPANTAGPYFGQLLPYRRIRTLAMWPLTGNIANSAQPFADFSGNWAQTSDFEGSGNGGWTGGGTSAPTLNGPSTDWAQHGARSMKVTMPTAAGGQAVTAVTAPQTGPSPWGLCIGQVYTWSVYVNRPAGGMPNVRLALKSGTALTASSGFSLTTSATGVTRLAGTFVCQDASNDVPVLFPIAATTAGQVFYYDAVQLEWGVAVPGAYTTSGPTVYQPFIGFVERWPTSWDHQGLFGYVELGATDALGALGQTMFVDPVYHATLDFAPAALYPLLEASGSTSAGNVAVPNVQPSLTLTNLPGGLTGKVASFGADSGPVGVGGQTLQLTNNTATPTVGQYLTSGTLDTKAGGTSGLTLMCWFKVPSAPSNVATICAAYNGVGDYISMAVGTDGGWRIYARLPGSTAETVFPGGAIPVADNAWHFAAIVVTNSGGTYTLVTVVDGASFGTTTATATNPAGSNSVGPYSTWVVGGLVKTRNFAGSLCYAGFINSAPFWGDLVNGPQKAGADGFKAETTIQRLARIAAWFGHSVLVAGSTSVQMQGAQNHNGKTGLQIFADISDTEGGALYVSSGFVVLQTRQNRQLSVNPTITFGEDATSGEVPYEADLRLTADVDFVYNDVTVSQVNGPDIRVADAASKTANFERDVSLEVYSLQASDAADHANYLLWRYKTPRERVANLSVEAGNRGGAAWAAVLHSYQPTLIQVKRRLPTGATVSGLHFIDKVQHDTDDRGGWKATVSASPVDPDRFWLLGDTTYGVLDSTTVAGW